MHTISEAAAVAQDEKKLGYTCQNECVEKLLFYFWRSFSQRNATSTIYFDGEIDALFDLIVTFEYCFFFIVVDSNNDASE